MKRLLFRIGSLGGGGAERVLVSLVRNLDQTRYKVTLLIETKGIHDYHLPPNVTLIFLFKGNTLLPNDPIIKGLYKAFRKVSILLLRTFPELLYLFKTIQTYDTEITCIQDLTPYAIGRIFDFSNHSRKIAWIHTDLFRKDYSDPLRKKIVSSLERFNSVVAVSQRVRDSLLELNPRLEGKISIIPNIVEVEQIRAKANELITIQKPDAVTIAFVGRLEKVKGADRLLRVCHRLLLEGLSLKLILIGDGTERQAIKTQINDLSLQHNVLITGFQKNPYPFLKMCDIFVLSSYAEGYPMAVTEAMVLGKPIVATSVSGIKEILDSARFGIVAENSEEGLYGGLKALVIDSGLRAHYSTMALEGAQRFEVTQVLSKFERHF